MCTYKGLHLDESLQIYQYKYIQKEFNVTCERVKYQIVVCSSTTDYRDRRIQFNINQSMVNCGLKLIMATITVIQSQSWEQTCNLEISSSWSLYATTEYLHRNRNSTIYLLIAFIFTPQRIIRRRVRFHSHSLCPVGILLLHTCILQHQYILFRLIHQ